MTRKHFVALAAMLKRIDGKLPSGDFAALVATIADLCESQNERFDRDRFVKAVTS